MGYVFNFMIFPGFLFSFICGMLVSWLDRKVTARLQGRVGPPWYQNFLDFAKLLAKETIIPKGGAKISFLLFPLIGLIGATIVSTIILKASFPSHPSFLGDIIVVLYFLILPPLALILGGASSANPFASIGVAREMKLLLGYELPFILAVLTPFITIESLRIGEIVAHQARNGMMFTNHLSSSIAFFVALLCIQAKLGYPPFEVVEAETEIMGGPLIEYSGPPLAIFKVNKAMLLFILPAFLVTLYLGGFSFKGLNIIWSFLKYLLIVFFIIMIKNINPRLRIDQALNLLWKRIFLFSLMAMVLALLGL